MTQQNDISATGVLNGAGQAGADEQVYDAMGAPTEDLQKALDATTQAVLTTACLELNNGAAATFTMNVVADVNVNPPQVRGGQITGSICGSPWLITGGTLGPTLVLTARRQGTGSCANTITIVGTFADPPRWVGTYGFDGNSTAFRHTTLFNGWRPC
jgi:hypothetical protein